MALIPSISEIQVPRIFRRSSWLCFMDFGRMKQQIKWFCTLNRLQKSMKHSYERPLNRFSESAPKEQLQATRVLFFHPSSMASIWAMSRCVMLLLQGLAKGTRVYALRSGVKSISISLGIQLLTPSHPHLC